MISAFGVEHGVIAKSLVNGVFKPASALSRAERGAVGGYKKAKGVSEEHRTFLQGAHERRKIVGENAAYKDVPVKPLDALLHGDRGFTIRTGSAKGGQSHVFGHASDTKSQKALQQHEGAHAAPKRSEYRMHHQIMGNPKKLMREEARADMASDYGSYRQVRMRHVASGKKKTVSVYGAAAKTGQLSQVSRAYPHLKKPELKEGVKAYRQTQDKIARAKGKKLLPTTTDKNKQNIVRGTILGVSAAAAGHQLHHEFKPKKRR